MEKSTTKYEMMVILQPDLGPEKTVKELDVVRGFLKEAGAKVYHEDLWGVRDLAYKIQKHTRGYYAVFYFEGGSDKLKELTHNLRLENSVMRNLIVKLPANYEIKPQSEFEIPPRERKEKRGPGGRGGARRAAPKKDAVEKKEEKAAAPKKEEKKPAEKKENLDKKIQSIVEDPDIAVS